MSFVAAIKRDIEQRFHPRRSETPGFPWIHVSNASSGVVVNEDTALNVTAVFNAVRIFAETVATLPLFVYERTDGGKQKAPDYPLFSLLHDRPNEEQTSCEFFEMMQGHVELRGNAYAIKNMDGRGRVRELFPLHPDKVKVKRIRGRIVYIVGQEEFPRERVMHVRGLSSDGLMGLSPLDLGIEAIGHALAVQEFSNRFFGNGSVLRGVLTHPSTLKPEAKKNLRESFEEIHKGVKNAHKFAILEEGLSWQEIGVKPEHAQLIESRNFSVSDIARLFNIPLHMLKQIEQQGFKSLEQLGGEFVTYSLRPRLVRWEKAIMRDLIPQSDQSQFFAEFNVDGLLRGDQQSRAQWYREGRQWGWLNPNDIRRLENLNPIPAEQGGDTFLAPLNMVPTEQLMNAPDVPEEMRDIHERNTKELRETRSIQQRKNLRESHSRVFRDAAGRLVTREVKSVRDILRRSFNQRDVSDFEGGIEDFYTGFEETARQIMAASVLTLAHSTHNVVAEEINSEPDFDESFNAFVSAYVGAFAVRHVGASLGQLRKILRESEQPQEEIAKRLDSWEEKRADQIASREVVQVESAVTKETYRSRGVTLKRWRTSGDNCPLCQRLDGRIVGIEESFVSAGEIVNPEDEKTSPLVVERDVGHPQLHKGCNCFVVAEGVGN